MDYTFVLKDKGTDNQGWWLKISNVNQFIDYLEQTTSTRNGKMFEDYWSHRGDVTHCRTDTYCVAKHSERNNLSFLQGLNSFSQMVALQQLKTIEETGCIYINRVGGYHGSYEGEPKYDFCRRKELVFPDFKKDQIRIKRFTGGEHFYAYIDDTQVRDGDVMKWNTYDEAMEKALMYLDN